MIDCFQAADVELHWPTNIALSPLDDTLHIVDDSQVLYSMTNIRNILNTTQHTLSKVLNQKIKHF